jgi:hypothetical protein
VPRKLDTVIKYFEYKNPNVHIKVFRSSQDPEVERMLNFFNAEASATLNLDNGSVEISILDDVFRKSAIYEELAHALQYHRDGNIQVDSIDHYKREIEVAECFLDRVSEHRLSLNSEEIEQTKSNLLAYKEAVGNLGG